MVQLSPDSLNRAHQPKPEYHVKPEEQDWAKTQYPGNGLPRIGIQFLSSALYRTYPAMGKVMLELAKSSQVFLIGAPGQIKMERPVENAVNLMDDKLTFRQSAAVVSTCDVCISPDSALVHSARPWTSPVWLFTTIPERSESTAIGPGFRWKSPCAPAFSMLKAQISSHTGCLLREEEVRCVRVYSSRGSGGEALLNE
jgi:ADP-heptose:LPS heptosyltransferase